MVDWQHDGGEGGKYPIGWPRINRSFKPGELDMSRYESLVFWLRTDSSREQAAIGRTPIGLVIRSHTMNRPLYEKTVDLGGRQHAWTALRFSVPEIMAAAGDGADRGSRSAACSFISPRATIKHGTRLVFDLGEAVGPARCRSRPWLACRPRVTCCCLAAACR